MSTRSASFLSVLVVLGLVHTAVAADSAQGNILFEHWQLNLTGGGGITDLTNWVNYPAQPDTSVWRQSLESPDTGEDHYGERARGYLYPPQTGDYTFWIASDDNSQLLLSTDHQPRNARLIASVTSWTGWRQWNAVSTQKSAPVPLIGGQRYYIEALYCDGVGSGFMSVGWAGPGVPSGPASRLDPAVIAGRYLAPFLRSPEPLLMAGNPQPLDGAAGVSSATLTWTAGITAKQHDVYFGATSNPPFVKRQTETTYAAPTFAVGQKYYWRIDEVEADGTTIYPGTVWSFTAAAPLALAPLPVDGAANVFPAPTLSWLAGTDAVKHRLYFGTDSAAVTGRGPTTDKGLLTTATFSPGVLRSSTAYYWMVDEVQGNGTVTPGALWSFITETGAIHQVRREWWTDVVGSTVDTLTSDPRFPDEPTGTDLLDDFEGPVNWGENYGSRLRGWLVAPTSGTYRFWITSDDSSELRLSLDADPANVPATPTAFVTWAPGEHDWSAQPGQQSAPVTLTAGRKYYLEALMKENLGWDHVSVAWQPPGETRQLLSGQFMDGFALSAQQAWIPAPKDGATEVAPSPTLGWSAGEQATKHRIYFGTDKAAVAAAGTSTAGLYKGEQTATTFAPGALAWGKTYYWRIDEISGATVRKGNLWSFTTANFLLLDDFESYDVSAGGLLWYTWLDGWANGTNSLVGYSWPSTERTVVHTGQQSMPFAYNNAAAPYYSEATREWPAKQDWTANGLDTLSLWFRAQYVRAIESPANTLTISAGGDWDDATDACRFVYKRLSGDGEIVARVEPFPATPWAWAKAGIMIRENLNPGARSVEAIVYPGGGPNFDWRAAVSGQIQSSSAGGFAAPHWVKLSRTADLFTAQHSSDGVTWKEDFWSTSSIAINMTGSVYVGLVVASRNSTGIATAKLSHVAITGATGSWGVADIGGSYPGNQASALYVTLQDTSGATATVNHPSNTTAVLKMDWTQWKVPLSSFKGVNLGAITRLTLGVGTRTNPKASGDGCLFLDDIRVIKSTSP